MAEVRLERVDKTYAGMVHALHDVNLSVRDGELLVLVGASGSGKTTTLRLIAGLEKATRGDIFIGGRLVNAVPSWQRNVSFVFQRPALHPNRTIRDNMLFAAGLRHPWRRLAGWLLRSHGAEDRAAAVRMAHLLELDGVLDRYPPELSGGQQQRAALARALLRQAAVFLLDEPLGHLDGPLRVELRRQLHLLHRQLPATMIYVTHDPAEALALGDRLAVLDGGVLQQVGPPQEIVARPANRRVAEIVCNSDGPISFLHGRLIDDNGLLFRWAGKEIRLPAAESGRWQAFRGREITLGIRSKALEIRSGRAGGLSLRVDLLESQGDHYLASCSAHGCRLTAWAGLNDGLSEGQEVMAELHWPRVLLFDRTGASLWVDSLWVARPESSKGVDMG